MSLEEIETAQPHFIPGYTGYCPQYIYRVGDTFGTTSHKLFIDPCVSHAEKIILSDRSQDDYQLSRPTLCEIDLIRNHEADGDALYQHPMIPGYEGFIPRKNDIFGQRFSIAATEGLADFQRAILKQKCNNRKIKNRAAIALSTAGGRSIGERSLTKNDYKLPLNAVRPECAGIIRELKKEEIPPPPPRPHCGEVETSNKGYHPFSWPRFGHGNDELTNSILCDFTNNYLYRKSVEWAPITNAGVGRSQASGPIYEIYLKNIGLIPNYAGHVPGAIFRFGASFGNDTRDAKRWLRGDFSN